MNLPTVDEDFLWSVINEASELWAVESGSQVDLGARLILVEGALDHAPEIADELRRRVTSREGIVRAAMAQFRTAAEVAIEERTMYATESVGGEGDDSRMVLTREDMEAGMKKKCHFIPWC